MKFTYFVSEAGPVQTIYNSRQCLVLTVAPLYAMTLSILCQLVLVLSATNRPIPVKNSHIHYHSFPVPYTDLSVILKEKGGLPLPLKIQLSCFCLLYTSPSPRDGLLSRMPSSA